MFMQKYIFTFKMVKIVVDFIVKLKQLSTFALIITGGLNTHQGEMRITRTLTKSERVPPSVCHYDSYFFGDDLKL